MRIQTLLNRVEKFNSFVYGAARLAEHDDGPVLVVQMEPRTNSRVFCSGCGRPGPVYDRLEPRRFEFVPVWGILVFLAYRMRRVDCKRCGVTVEMVPWCDGKNRLMTTYRWFLAPWARRLSWSEVGSIFRTSWDSVCRAVEHAVECGLAHWDLSQVTALGVDEIAWRAKAVTRAKGVNGPKRSHAPKGSTGQSGHTRQRGQNSITFVGGGPGLRRGELGFSPLHRRRPETVEVQGHQPRGQKPLNLIRVRAEPGNGRREAALLERGQRLRYRLGGPSQARPMEFRGSEHPGLMLIPESGGGLPSSRPRGILSTFPAPAPCGTIAPGGYRHADRDADRIRRRHAPPPRRRRADAGP
jgi:hypothetical protein